MNRERNVGSSVLLQTQGDMGYGNSVVSDYFLG